MQGAKLARIIGVLLAGGLIVACSTVKLAYNNLPELAYWWLDGYVDFDGAQTLRVREDLSQLQAWHRSEELPKVAALLRRAQALAPEDASPAQACELADGLRERVLAVATQAKEAGTTLALSLGEAQIRQLERKYERLNADYRKEWLALAPEARQKKRYDRLLERHEDFYGRLDAAQREQLRAMTAQSVFDADRIDTQRRERQVQILTLLRRFQAEQTPPAEARAAVDALVQDIVDPPAGPQREHQQALLQESCRNLAALHNTTTPEQRVQAVRRLRAYESDMHALVASR